MVFPSPALSENLHHIEKKEDKHIKKEHYNVVVQYQWVSAGVCSAQTKNIVGQNKLSSIDSICSTLLIYHEKLI